MTPEEFEQLIHTPTADGRLHEKVQDPTELLDAKNQIVRARKREDGKCLFGGIINHVDPDLRFMYVRSLATKGCFCLQIPLYEFWILPRKDPTDRDSQWMDLMEIVAEQR